MGSDYFPYILNFSYALLNCKFSKENGLFFFSFLTGDGLFSLYYVCSILEANQFAYFIVCLSLPMLILSGAMVVYPI
jgi:hypothetical protein